MSAFKLEDRGGGKFALIGRMGFDTAGRILYDSEEMFEEHTRIEVDLAGVTETDSAGLALLLEWITWANHTRSVRSASSARRRKSTRSRRRPRSITC